MEDIELRALKEGCQIESDDKGHLKDYGQSKVLF